MKNKKQSLIEGSYILLFTAIITKIIGAVFKIPLSSNYCLGDLGFGYFSAAYDLYLPISTLAISGFPVAISRIIADYVANRKQEEIKSVLKASKKILLIVSVAEFILISALIYPISKFTDSSGQGIYCLLAVLPSVFISSILSLYRGYFEGLSQMKPAAVSNIVEALGKLILGFSFAFLIIKFTNNVAFAAAGALLGINIGLLISLLYIYVKYRISSKEFSNNNYKTNINLTKSIIIVVLPVALASLGTSFVALIDSLTVRVQLSMLINDFEGFYKSLIDELNLTSSELPTVLYGIKSKAFTLFNLVLTLTTALGISVVPTITECKVHNDNIALINNSNSSLKLTTLICFPIALGFVFVGNNIMTFLFGNSASSFIGGKMLLIYGLAAVFAGVSIVLSNILQGIGSFKTVFLNISFGIILKVIFNILFTSVSKFNIYGCCYSTLICYFIICCLHLISFFNNTGKLPLANIFIKPFFASTICGLTAFIICNISESKMLFLCAIVSAAIIYFLCLLILKFFTFQDMQSIPFANKIYNMCKNTKK